MKRGEMRLTKEEQFGRENYQDKQWTSWAERRMDTLRREAHARTHDSNWNSHCACKQPCVKWPGCKPDA